MKLLFLAAILILPAGAANWERWNHSGKGLGIGPADPHPLSYFTRYPSLRDPYFCHNCSPEKRLALAKQEKLKEKQRTEVKLVGTVYGFKVYDVLYSFSRRWVNPPAENVEYHDEAVEWKSILVLTGPNQYREIWFDEKVQGDFSPSFLSQVGDKMLLGLIDECYRCGCLEQYWLFDKDGPTHIELEPIWRAAIALVPKGHYLSCTYNYRDTLTYFSRGAIEFGLDKQPPEGGPAEHVPGIIKVSFNWDRGQVVITGTEYDPTAE